MAEENGLEVEKHLTLILSVDEENKTLPKCEKPVKRRRRRRRPRPKERYICSTCNKELSTRKILRLHEATHLEVRRRFDCNYCDRNFLSRRGRNLHQKSHTGEGWHPCTMCDKKFNQPNRLKLHILTHTGEKNYFCKLCPKGFIKKSSFVNHVRRHDCEKRMTQIRVVTEKSSPEVLIISASTEPEDNVVVSEKVRGESEVQCEKSEKDLLESQTNGAKSCPSPTQQLLAKTPDFRCHYCPKRFMFSSYLKMHLRIHTGEKPFACTLCGASFSGDRSLKRHMETHQVNRTRHACTLCDRSFLSRDKLATHFKMHTGKGLMKCAYCDKKFNALYRKKKHELVHTGEKLFSCQFCPKRLSDRNSLLQHTRLHTGERPYVCHVCLASFLRSNDLKIHIKSKHPEPDDLEDPDSNPPSENGVNVDNNSAQDDTTDTSSDPALSKLDSLCVQTEMIQHENKKSRNVSVGQDVPRPSTEDDAASDEVWKKIPVILQKSYGRKRSHTCQICQKTFPFRSSLKSHLMCHTKEKPYSCPVCNKKFSSGSSLRYHKQRHQMDRTRHKCSFCDKTFVCLKSLGKHQEKHAVRGTSENSGELERKILENINREQPTETNSSALEGTDDTRSHRVTSVHPLSEIGVKMEEDELLPADVDIPTVKVEKPDSPFEGTRSPVSAYPRDPTHEWILPDHIP